MRYIGNDIKMTVNKLTVSCNDEGSNGNLVIFFIHGFPFNQSMRNKQTVTLKDNYRVLTFDIRGHGNSEAEDEDFSIELFVNDLLMKYPREYFHTNRK